MLAAAAPALAAGDAVSPANPAATTIASGAGLPSGPGPEFRRRMLGWTGPGAPGFPAADTASVPLSAPVDDFRRRSSGFGTRVDPFGRGVRRHAGVDIPGRAGTPVRAAGAGVVTFAGVAAGYGNLVEVDHGDGVRTRYAHLSRIAVARGRGLGAGDVLGRMGSTGRSTGNHLHYEVRMGGRAVDPDRPVLSEARPRAVIDQPEVAPRRAGVPAAASDRLPFAGG